MKYCKTFCIYAAVLIVMCSTWIEDGTAQTWMPDANLRTKVLTALKSSDTNTIAQTDKLPAAATTFTQAQLAKLKRLEADGSGGSKISNLKGLGEATGLTYLDLDSNSISDISALSSLTELTTLRLTSNQISNISTLKSLTKLTRLEGIANNQIRDISALSSLTELVYLEIHNNQINDISPLKGLTKLRWLYAHGNQIYSTSANIAALKSLTALEHLALIAPTQNDLPKLEAARNAENPDESLLRALLVDPPPPPPAPATTDESAATDDEPVETRRRIIYECPVGWTRGSLFGKTKKALIYELKVDVDLTNPVSIYTLKSIAIYVHPDEGLQTLDGWHLTTGTLYNHAHENKFHLTAENSVIDEQGFAHIENPDATPIRMGMLGYIGQSLPSFDYRLYDTQGVRVDFGISCYKAGGLTWRLWNTKDPRVLRVLPLVESEGGLKAMMKDLNWNAFFYRSEWTAAVMPDLPVQNAPFAPSKPKVNVVGTWADLKKGKN